MHLLTTPPAGLAPVLFLAGSSNVAEAVVVETTSNRLSPCKPASDTPNSNVTAQLKFGGVHFIKIDECDEAASIVHVDEASSTFSQSVNQCWPVLVLAWECIQVSDQEDRSGNHLPYFARGTYSSSNPSPKLGFILLLNRNLNENVACSHFPDKFNFNPENLGFDLTA